MTIGTAASRSERSRNMRLGLVSLGQPKRCDWIATSVQRHAPITAAGTKPARNSATTETLVTSPITIMKIAGGTSMPIAVPAAISGAPQRRHQGRAERRDLSHLRAADVGEEIRDDDHRHAEPAAQPANQR